MIEQLKEETMPDQTRNSEEGRPSDLEMLARRMESAAPHPHEISGLRLADLDYVAENAMRRGYELGAAAMAGEVRETAEQIEAKHRVQRAESGDREFNDGASEQAKRDREAIEELAGSVRSIEFALQAVVTGLPPSTPPSRARAIESAYKKAHDAARDLKRFAEGGATIGRVTHIPRGDR